MRWSAVCWLSRAGTRGARARAVRHVRWLDRAIEVLVATVVPRKKKGGGPPVGAWESLSRSIVAESSWGPPRDWAG